VWYSYAIVRVVPRVERGEFVNVGVVLFAREQEFCRASVELDRDRLLSLAPGIALAAVERHLATFVAICEGRPEGGPIAALQAPERFYWLVSPRSTRIQTSPVHVGRLEPEDGSTADDPARAATRLAATLENLLAEFVRLPAASLRSAGGDLRA
jgi:hypothetical protein